MRTSRYDGFAVPVRGMLMAFLSLLMLPALSEAKKVASADQCLACHATLGGETAAPVVAFRNDVHAKASLSCADCHGGDRTQRDMQLAMSPAAGFIGVPTAEQIPGFCGRCHSDASYMKRFNPAMRVDQQTEYATSVHGKRLAQGDAKVATCVKCHGNHGVRAVSDATSPVYPLNVANTCGKCHADKALMNGYGIPTTQTSDYFASAHAKAMIKGGDMSAPTCNDCHGNHGATPPGVASVAHVCGSCHVRQAELFEKSPHASPFAESGQAGCLACHSNHKVLPATDEHVGVQASAVCVSCHSDGDKGFEVAKRLRASIARLAGDIDGTSRLLAGASDAGMEVSRSQFELKAAHDKLVEARVLVHGANAATLDSVVNAGLGTVSKVRSAGNRAMDELDFRRRGLIISLAVILIAAMAVYAKVRQIERRQRRALLQTAASPN